MPKNVLVAGGAGFVGSCVVRQLIEDTDHRVLVVDKLTYAGNLDSLAPVAENERFAFARADISDASRMREAICRFKPDVIMNLAAETHVDRSIEGPAPFIETNIVGTFVLLNEALTFWRGLDAAEKETFRFHHISTDEVFGSLGAEGVFTEDSPYRPNSPYSASKAASDHLVRAWAQTYGLPVLISHSSNNYGPYQFPEKLIPLTIINALEGKTLRVYGSGENVRDWLHVRDHARALIEIAESGRPGRTYNVGAGEERRNIDVVRTICRILDEIAPDAEQKSRETLIEFVADRPGHDLRYAADCSRLRDELGWRPSRTFETGLAQTVRWYLDHAAWWNNIRSNGYRGERLGLID